MCQVLTVSERRPPREGLERPARLPDLHPGRAPADRTTPGGGPRARTRRRGPPEALADKADTCVAEVARDCIGAVRARLRLSRRRNGQKDGAQ